MSVRKLLCLACVSTAWVLCSLKTVSAEEQPTPVPVPAETPASKADEMKPLDIKNLIFTVPVLPPAEWERVLADFQGADAEKQKVATQALLDSGIRGFNDIAKFLNSPNTDLATRSKQVQAEINKKSWQHFTETSAFQNKFENEPLTVPVLKDLQKAWTSTALYSSQPALRKSGFEQVSALQTLIQTVETAQKDLAIQEQFLAETPQTNKLMRGGILIDKAKALKTLRRIDDTIAAVKQALELCGPQWRQVPQALRLLIEAFDSKQDTKNSAELARRILSEYPRSLEAKFAYDTLLGATLAEGDWNGTLKLLKDYYAACPLDPEVNDRIFSVLTALQEEHHQYQHVVALAEWIITTLPKERLTPDAPKLAGGICEYVLRDYAKAEKYYRILGEVFSDALDPKDMEAVLARIKAKIEGKFPKEPAVTEEGVAGVLAKFLKAVRSRDNKAAAALVAKDEAEQYESGEAVEGLIAALTFSDYVLKKVDIDEKATEATLTLDMYEAGSNAPKPMTQKALKEDGVWKIAWADEDEKNNMQLMPAEGAAPVTPVPANPATPAAPLPAVTPAAPTGK